VVQEAAREVQATEMVQTKAPEMALAPEFVLTDKILNESSSASNPKALQKNEGPFASSVSLI
jgi:hypothetical protein